MVQINTIKENLFQRQPYGVYLKYVFFITYSILTNNFFPGCAQSPNESLLDSLYGPQESTEENFDALQEQDTTSYYEGDSTIYGAEEENSTPLETSSAPFLTIDTSTNQPTTSIDISNGQSKTDDWSSQNTYQDYQGTNNNLKNALTITPLATSIAGIAFSGISQSASWVNDRRNNSQAATENQAPIDKTPPVNETIQRDTSTLQNLKSTNNPIDKEISTYINKLNSESDPELQKNVAASRKAQLKNQTQELERELKQLDFLLQNSGRLSSSDKKFIVDAYGRILTRLANTQDALRIYDPTLPNTIGVKIDQFNAIFNTKIAMQKEKDAYARETRDLVNLRHEAHDLKTQSNFNSAYFLNEKKKYPSTTAYFFTDPQTSAMSRSQESENTQYKKAYSSYFETNPDGKTKKIININPTNKIGKTPNLTGTKPTFPTKKISPQPIKYIRKTTIS